MIDSVAGAIVSAIPAARTSIDVSNGPYPLSASNRTISIRPTATVPSPVATTSFEP